MYMNVGIHHLRKKQVDVEQQKAVARTEEAAARAAHETRLAEEAKRTTTAIEAVAAKHKDRDDHHRHNDNNNDNHNHHGEYDVIAKPTSDERKKTRKTHTKRTVVRKEVHNYNNDSGTDSSESDDPDEQLRHKKIVFKQVDVGEEWKKKKKKN